MADSENFTGELPKETKMTKRTDAIEKILEEHIHYLQQEGSDLSKVVTTTAKALDEALEVDEKKILTEILGYGGIDNYENDPQKCLEDSKLCAKAISSNKDIIKVRGQDK